MLRKLFLSLVALASLSALFSSSVTAQVTAGAQFTVGLPQGEFSNRLDGAIGFGISGHALYAIPRLPVGIGGEVGFIVYGQETIRQRFGSGALGRVDVDVVTTNNVMMGHFLVRFQPQTGMFRPYADALLGANYLFTESRIQDVRGDRPEIASSTNFDDIAFSYGGGVGFQTLLLDHISETGRRGQLALDVRLRYLLGSEAQYLKRGSIDEDDAGNVTYEIERSRTDLLLPQVGLLFRF